MIKTTLKISCVIGLSIFLTGMGKPIGEIKPALNSSSSLLIGSKAPEFTLPNSFGNSISLSQFRGKRVILEWKNHQCPFVKKHYHSGNMQNTQALAKKNGYVWLSIISSAPGKQGYVSGKKANEIVENENSLATHVLLDPKGKVGHLYKAKTTPHMFIISETGNLLYKGAIDSIPTPVKSDVKEATNYVHQVINELKSKKQISVSETKPYGCSVKY